MENVLFFSGEERTRFDALSEDLRDGWKVEEEKQLQHMESPREIAMRQNMATFQEFPAIRLIVDRIQQKGGIENFSFGDLPDAFFSEFCFTIGARGITVLIAALLPEAKTDEDLRGLHALSIMRHELLAVNASVSYA